MSPTQLNIAFQLVFAYEHQPHLLNDAESFRKVTGLRAADNTEVLDVVRSIVEGLQNKPSHRGIPFTDPLQKG
jgi:hypothetical protein